jgi:AcrR family transcriptional regulator
MAASAAVSFPVYSRCSSDHDALQTGIRSNENRQRLLKAPSKSAAKVRTRGRPTPEAASELTVVIVDVALELFKQQGYKAASIDEIAKRCQTSKHSIYRRFASKDVLFEAAVAKDRQKILDSIGKVDIDNDDVLAALRDTAHAIFEIAVSQGSADLYRMCIGAIPRFPNIGAQFLAGEKLIRDILEPLIIRAQQAGLLAQGDSRRLSGQLHFTTVGEIWSRALLGEAYVGDAQSQADLFEANWQLFLRGAGEERTRS